MPLWHKDYLELNISEKEQAQENLWKQSRIHPFLREISFVLNPFFCCAGLGGSAVSSQDPMDCSPPGSSVRGFARQAYRRELPYPPPGDSSQPRGRIQVFRTEGGFFTAWATSDWESRRNGKRISMEEMLTKLRNSLHPCLGAYPMPFHCWPPSVPLQLSFVFSWRCC